MFWVYSQLPKRSKRRRDHSRWGGRVPADGGTGRKGETLRFPVSPQVHLLFWQVYHAEEKTAPISTAWGNHICRVSGAPADTMLSKQYPGFLRGEKKHCWAAGISIPYSTLMTWQLTSGTLTSVWLRWMSSLLTSGKVNKNHVSRTQIVNWKNQNFVTPLRC